MEPIYVSMLFTEDKITELKVRPYAQGLVSEMNRLIELYTLDQLLPPMKQWALQLQQTHPYHINHKAQVGTTNPKLVGGDPVKKYRAYRAIAKKSGITHHVYNCYLLHLVLAEPVAPVQETD